jgi:hypothetical protein
MSTRSRILPLCLAVLAGCAAPSDPTPAERPPTTQPAPPKPPPPAEPPGPGRGDGRPQAGLREVFPHIRVDQATRLVEIDGIVPIDAHNAETPNVYLEVTLCTRDSKEHESLVMTDARPSNVHAALLLLGLEPGKPGAIRFEGGAIKQVPPTGAGLRVSIAYKDRAGKEVEAPASDWVVNAETRARFSPPGQGPAWVFAGSRFVMRQGKEWYDADGAGTLIGLTTFGGETIAWARVHSPEAALEPPEWIADAAKVPAFETPVIVRIRPAE